MMDAYDNGIKARTAFLNIVRSLQDGTFHLKDFLPTVVTKLTVMSEGYVAHTEETDIRMLQTFLAHTVAKVGASPHLYLLEQNARQCLFDAFALALGLLPEGMQEIERLQIRGCLARLEATPKVYGLNESVGGELRQFITRLVSIRVLERRSLRQPEAIQERRPTPVASLKDVSPQDKAALLGEFIWLGQMLAKGSSDSKAKTKWAQVFEKIVHFANMDATIRDHSGVKSALQELADYTGRDQGHFQRAVAAAVVIDGWNRGLYSSGSRPEDVRWKAALAGAFKDLAKP